LAGCVPVAGNSSKTRKQLNFPVEGLHLS
jgi:hypothetical protein